MHCKFTHCILEEKLVKYWNIRTVTTANSLNCCRHQKVYLWSLLCCAYFNKTASFVQQRPASSLWHQLSAILVRQWKGSLWFIGSEKRTFLFIPSRVQTTTAMTSTARSRVSAQFDHGQKGVFVATQWQKKKGREGARAGVAEQQTAARHVVDRLCSVSFLHCVAVWMDLVDRRIV